MNPNDMVYNAIYKGALHAGASEKQSRDQAVIGLQMYKRGQFKKAVDLIEAQIKTARDLTSKDEKKKAQK